MTGAILQTEPAYRFDLRLRLTGDKASAAERIVRISGLRTPFNMELSTPPRQLDGDPDISLFRRLAPHELPAAINDLLTPQRPLVIVATGQNGLLQASRELLKGLHWEHAEFLAEAEAQPTALAGKDLLFLGWPQRREIRPALPAGLAANQAGIPAWSDPGRPRESDVLFAVLAGRNNRDGVRALFLANTPETARSVAPKIAHYGRYSLLLFAAGRNVVKTTWEPQSSPLTVKFTPESRP